MSDLEEYILRRRKVDKEFARNYDGGLENFKMFRPDLETIVSEFMSQTKSDEHHRYFSFDYCFNYFSSTENLTKDIEKSCLMLGFYLASWGMFRGASFLLQKNVKCFEKSIHYISGLDKSVWQIDVDNYTDENIETIIKLYCEIKRRLIENGNRDLVLITKILLGVFGFVPAFDRFFTDTFRDISGVRCRFRSLNVNSLTVIRDFYVANQATIDKLSKQIFTTDFLTGRKTTRNYPKAKIIDMYGFQLANSTRQSGQSPL